MSKLVEYILDHQKTSHYFKSSLRNTSVMSTLILKTIDINKGKFFTLLPKGLSSEQLGQFSHGGLSTGAKKTIHTYILKFLLSSPNFSCIFDDISSAPQNEVFQTSRDAACNSVLHLLSSQNGSLEQLREYFHISNAIWYSLCILTDYPITQVTNSHLSSEVLQKACEHIQLIVLGAYDDESYIFWAPDSIVNNLIKIFHSEPNP